MIWCVSETLTVICAKTNKGTNGATINEWRTIVSIVEPSESNGANDLDSSPITSKN